MSRAGPRTRRQSDGPSGLALAQSETFGLILLDLQLPGIDGIEIARRVRRDSPNQRIPIVAMTANVLPLCKEMCLAAGMNEQVTKPFNLDVIYDRLLEVLTVPRDGRG